MLKPFVPETLGGLKRTDFSAERNGAMGMQVSEAHATYSDGANRALQLEVTDTGSAKGFLSLAGWAAVQNDKRNRSRLREDLQAERPPRARAMGQHRPSTANTASCSATASR